MSLLLTIAGTDPSGGAGIQVDLNVFRDYHSHGLSCITAILSQNTTGVHDTYPLPPDIVAKQLDAILDDFAPSISAIKIGLLPTPEVVTVVAQKLRPLVLPECAMPTPIVLDPVLASGINNAPLVTAKTVEAIKHELVSLTTIMTPNYPEALIFAGNNELNNTPEERQSLLLKLVEESKTAVLLKGGHIDETSDKVTDLIGFPNHSITTLSPLPRYQYDVRGTGCQLSSAIASEFVSSPPTSNENLIRAVEGARRYLHDKLRCAHSIGKGRRVVVRTSEFPNNM